MLVKELIEKLQEMPQDWPVIYHDFEWGATQIEHAVVQEVETGYRKPAVPAVALVEAW